MSEDIYNSNVFSSKNKTKTKSEIFNNIVYPKICTTQMFSATTKKKVKLLIKIEDFFFKQSLFSLPSPYGNLIKKYLFFVYDGWDGMVIVEIMLALCSWF